MLQTIFNLLGGLPAMLQVFIDRLIKQADQVDIDQAADRMFTVSKADHRKLCRTAGITDDAIVAEGDAIRLAAADKMGDYLAFFAKHKLGIDND